MFYCSSCSKQTFISQWGTLFYKQFLFLPLWQDKNLWILQCFYYTSNFLATVLFTTKAALMFYQIGVTSLCSTKYTQPQDTNCNVRLNYLDLRDTICGILCCKFLAKEKFLKTCIAHSHWAGIDHRLPMKLQGERLHFSMHLMKSIHRLYFTHILSHTQNI